MQASSLGPWWSFLYLYGLGGVLYALPILAGLRFHVVDWRRPGDRLLLIGFAVAYGVYGVGHGVWMLLADAAGGG